MAVDKFTEVPQPEARPSASEDAWKDKQIQREHTPAKVQSHLTYRQIEQQIEQCDANIATQESRKAELEADLVKIEAVANPSD